MPRRCCFLLFFLLLGGCSNYRMVVQGVDFDRLAASYPAGEEEKITRERAAYHNDLGVLLEEEGDLEGAIKQYRLAIRKDPDLAIAYFNAGNVSVRRGMLDQAVAYYRKALRRRPDHPRTLNNLAWVYLLRRENIESAVELLNRAARADPENPYLYLDSLGWAHYLAGRRGEALGFLQRALRETPPGQTYLLGEAHYHLGLIFQEGRDREKAEFHLRKCLSLNPSPERKTEIDQLLENPNDKRNPKSE